MSFKLDVERFRDATVELIRRAATQLPNDVVLAMENARDSEAEGSPARSVLDYMLKNAEAAKENSTPICQDTGTNIHFVTIPEGVSLRKIESAVAEATRLPMRRALTSNSSREFPTWTTPLRARESSQIAAM